MYTTDSESENAESAETEGQPNDETPETESTELSSEQLADEDEKQESEAEDDRPNDRNRAASSRGRPRARRSASSQDPRGVLHGAATGVQCNRAHCAGTFGQTIVLPVYVSV